MAWTSFFVVKGVKGSKDSTPLLLSTPSSGHGCAEQLCVCTLVAALQVKKEAPLFGFEQEYTMLQKGSGLVLGWPEGGYPAPQVRPSWGQRQVAGRLGTRWRRARAHVCICVCW